jgi:hypothetical protein
MEVEFLYCAHPVVYYYVVVLHSCQHNKEL